MATSYATQALTIQDAFGNHTSDHSIRKRNVRFNLCNDNRVFDEVRDIRKPRDFPFHPCIDGAAPVDSKPVGRAQNGDNTYNCNRRTFTHFSPRDVACSLCCQCLGNAKGGHCGSWMWKHCWCEY